MSYTNNIPYYSGNIYRNSYRRPGPPKNNRFGLGGFAVPFALGFLSAPLFYRPNYYPYPNYGYYRPNYYYY